MKKSLLALLATAALLTGEPIATADAKNIPFAYKNEDIIKVIDDYSKASGQKFIIDPAVHGKVTIINKGPISVAEAFNQLSSALAVNSLAISTQEDMMVVAQARSIQRNLIDVGNDLPPLKPERMFTWVIKLKSASAEEVNKQLRILSSRDGELVPYAHTNQIIVTDWVSNLYRISKLVKQIDDPANAVARPAAPVPTEAKNESKKDAKKGPPKYRADSN